MIRVAVDAMGGDSAPQVLAVASGLQLTFDLHRPGEPQPQPLKGRIVGRELPVGPHGSPLKIPDVHSKHSRLR